LHMTGNADCQRTVFRPIHMRQHCMRRLQGNPIFCRTTAKENENRFHDKTYLRQNKTPCLIRKSYQNKASYPFIFSFALPTYVLGKSCDFLTPEPVQAA